MSMKGYLKPPDGFISEALVLATSPFSPLIVIAFVLLDLTQK